MHRDDAFHVREVERNAAERRVDMTFERCAGAKWDDRHAGRRAELHHLRYFRLCLGEHDSVWRLTFEPGECVGVLLAQGLAHRESIAETRGKSRKKGLLALAHRPFCCLGQTCGHGRHL
jgi:hypothetical protein